MKLSKLRNSTRSLAGKEIPRQDRTSTGLQKALKKAGSTPFAGESGEVGGSPAKTPLARARRCGGMVKRADGGSVLSEDSKREAARLRNEASGDRGSATVAGGVAAGLAAMPVVGGRVARGIHKGIVGGNLLAAGSRYLDSRRNDAEADRIEHGRAEPGKEDRKHGGKVK